MATTSNVRKIPFLSGVFFITFSSLLFQILQTRIMSVVQWYSMAFLAICVAMLGMTVGAVWVYLQRERFQPALLPATLSNFALLTAVAMPASMILQFCLITSPTLSLTTVVSWVLLLTLMAIPYIFAGVVVSLALTRSPFPAGQVYGVDLLGAALGCVAVLALLDFLDAPSAVIAAGSLSGFSAVAFAASADEEVRQRLRARPWWRQPSTVASALLALAFLNALSPIGFNPIMSKNLVDFRSRFGQFERWNSYSRIRATRPQTMPVELWGASSQLPADLRVPKVVISIDDLVNTTQMFHYDGTLDSISFLQYDIVNLAYRLPGIHKSAVIGLGGGEDVLSAHFFGVTDITGVEVNSIIVDLSTRDPFYSHFSNLTAIPHVRLYADDARSWFAASHEKFDLVQMSIADSFEATGAGAYSLSANGLYTLEAWRAFLKTVNSDGIFTISRWYAPGNVNESGRLIGLATASLLDTGIQDVRPYLYVANNHNLATVVISKAPFTAEQLRILHRAVQELGFDEMITPERPPETPLLRQIVESHDLATLNRVLDSTYLDLTVPTDQRPFFFNQLRIFDLRSFVAALPNLRDHIGGGVWLGNLMASTVLVLILLITIIAVIATILIPLRSALRACSLPLVFAGSMYFSAIGMGFMLAEIALLQYFSVYLGHPTYSLSVCLFSLILASGLGSLTSDRLKLNTRGKLLVWGCLVAAYLIAMQQVLPSLFQATTNRERSVRIAISVAAIFPLGFLLGFAFPTGMRLVSAIDTQPTPWFWGINGATSVLASVLGVIFSMSLGINVTLLIAAGCYLLPIPTSFLLLALRPLPAQPA